MQCHGSRRRRIVCRAARSAPASSASPGLLRICSKAGTPRSCGKFRRRTNKRARRRRPSGDVRSPVRAVRRRRPRSQRLAQRYAPEKTRVPAIRIAPAALGSRSTASDVSLEVRWNTSSCRPLVAGNHDNGKVPPMRRHARSLVRRSPLSVFWDGWCISPSAADLEPLGADDFGSPKPARPRQG